MAEHVETLDLGVTWDPNAPYATLVSTDMGQAVLALNPHPSDSDRRCVVLLWSGAASACMSAPNDEAISGHRLYPRGLADVVWAGRVQESELVKVLERQNSVHPFHNPARFTGLTHFVLPLKECVVECVAEHVAVVRDEGPTVEAALAVLRGAASS